MERAENRIADTASAIFSTIDRELLASIRTLQALIATEYLDSGDLRQSYEQAKRVLTLLRH